MKNVVVVVVAFAVSGCFDLDSFVWNPKHCSLRSAESFGEKDELCEDKNMCTACGDPLPFEKFGIPADKATQHPIVLEEDKTNDSWFVASSGGPLSDVTIVFSHGNFGGIEHYLNRVALLFQTGANVYAVDYRGFGQSSTTAEPTELQFQSDTAFARDGLPAILQEHGVSTSAVVLMGYSAGALSAVEMAVTDPSCGIVLEAPWPSVQAFADDSTFIGVPGSFVTTGTWDNISKMATYKQPYLHLHGSEDQTVRIELGEEMFDASPSTQKEFLAVEGAQHGNFLGKEGEIPDVAETLGQREYVEKIAGFVSALDCD
ncbi:MAG: alpha/beta hydrolase [Deltaproteobacteria bacterium]|nr:alpha/beta hydrolase [Deltaproteobacteria bacterium]